MERLYFARYSAFIFAQSFTFQYGKIILILEKDPRDINYDLHSNMERLYYFSFCNIFYGFYIYIPIWKDYTCAIRGSLVGCYYLHSNMERLYIPNLFNNISFNIIYIPIWKDYTHPRGPDGVKSNRFTFQYGKIIPKNNIIYHVCKNYLHSNMERLYKFSNLM